MKKYLIILVLGLISFQSWAAIEYRLRYNSGLDVFEVYFVSTISYPGPTAVGPSQATVVFDPAYNTAAIVTTPNMGGAWLAQDKATGNTGSVNTKKVVGFQTSGAPIAGGVTAGTQYKLFSFTFGAGQNCGAGTLRLFVNTVDPADVNGAGGDFTSYLNIGGTDQLSTNTDVTFRNCASLAVLPVRFTVFNVIKKDQDGILNWSTENQDRMASHFEIERSTDGNDFISLGRVDITVTPNGAATYNYIDRNVKAVRSTGPVYYRIKQIDKDGKYAYTEIRNIRFDNKMGVHVYPNPAKAFTTVTMDLPEATQVQIRITDAGGKEVQKIEIAGFKGVNQQRIELNKLAAGSYLIKLQAGSIVQTLPLVKSE